MASGTFPGLVSALWRPAGARAPAPDCYRLLFNPFATWGSLALLLLVSHLPPDGAGIPVCFFRAVTGLPCPGCGLTRAFSSLLQGRAEAAFAYHPFVFILLPLSVIAAAHNFLPAGVRQRLAEFCGRHDRSLRLCYHGFIYSLLVFGALRMLAYATTGRLGV